MLADTHVHLLDYPDREKLCDYLAGTGPVVHCMTVSPDEYVEGVKVFGGFERVRMSLGLLPFMLDDAGRFLDSFRELAAETRYIGEIGLDGVSDDVRGLR